jgi:alpha-glucoside transport system permease protein
VVIPESEVQAPQPPMSGDDSKELDPRSRVIVWLTRIVFALAIPAVLLGIIWAAGFIRDPDSNRGLVVIAAIVVGVLGVFLLYKGMDAVVDRLPFQLREGIRPWVFVGPALVILGVYLVYPAINTAVLSLKDARGRDFVGLDNFRHIFTDTSSLTSLRNSLLWILFVPFFAVAIGLLFATLADKLSKRAENAAKSIIFMPMAISMVGASVVWLFVYSFRPPGFGEQIGILNGIWTGLGREPVDWLLTEPWNNLFLMVILVWLQTGFAMVILSAAIKAVPVDIVEAARIDGASEFQVFWRVTFPTIASTVVVVATTITITVWKVFDIVFVMTGGRFGTSVVAQRMVTEFFTFRNTGRGAAFAVILFVAVIPIMMINVRRFRLQEELR